MFTRNVDGAFPDGGLVAAAVRLVSVSIVTC